MSYVTFFIGRNFYRIVPVFQSRSSNICSCRNILLAVPLLVNTGLSIAIMKTINIQLLKSHFVGMPGVDTATVFTICDNDSCKQVGLQCLKIEKSMGLIIQIAGC
jgi:hypothetical protein